MLRRWIIWGHVEQWIWSKMKHEVKVSSRAKRGDLQRHLYDMAKSAVWNFVVVHEWSIQAWILRCTQAWVAMLYCYCSCKPEGTVCSVATDGFVCCHIHCRTGLSKAAAYSQQQWECANKLTSVHAVCSHHDKCDRSYYPMHLDLSFFIFKGCSKKQPAWTPAGCTYFPTVRATCTTTVDMHVCLKASLLDSMEARFCCTQSCDQSCAHAMQCNGPL